MPRFYPRVNRRLKVLYHRSTSVTAKEIARQLGIGYTKSPSEDEVVVVRWGYSKPHANDLALNTAEAVELAAHGLESLITLEEAGVPCVSVVRTPPQDESAYPLMARCRYHHIGGKSIEFVESYEEAVETGAKYFTNYQKADKELRIHVFGGRALRVFRKVPRENTADMVIKTSDRGWGYHITNHEKYYHLAQDIAVSAVDSLGLHFGGVDMGWNEDERRYFVFEVNTAPALNSVSLRHYTKEFESHLKELELGYEPIP